MEPRLGVKLRDANKKIICRGSPIEVFRYMSREYGDGFKLAIIERLIRRLKQVEFMNFDSPENIVWEEDKGKILKCSPRVLSFLESYVGTDEKTFVYASRDLGYDIYWYDINDHKEIVNGGTVSLGEGRESWKMSSPRKVC